MHIVYELCVQYIIFWCTTMGTKDKEVFFDQKKEQGGLKLLFGQQGCLKSEPRTLCILPNLKLLFEAFKKRSFINTCSFDFMCKICFFIVYNEDNRFKPKTLYILLNIH